MKKIKCVFIVLFSLSLMIPAGALAVDPIKFGVPLIMTGGGAQLGIDNRNGIALAAKHKGTIMGRPIELIVEDTEGKSETGIRKAEKLVFKDKVVSLIGVCYSNVALAIAGELDNLKVPFVTTNSMTPKLYGLHPLAFRAGQLADDQSAKANVAGILKYPDLAKRSFYVLAHDYAWGHSCAEEFIKLGSEKGINIINKNYDKAALNVSDFSPFISKIAESKATAVYPCVTGPVYPRFVDQAKKFGLLENTRAVGSSVSEEVLESTGDSLLGVVGICNYSWDLDTPKSNAFAKAYWEEFKLIPGSYGAHAYTGAMILFNAIENAQSTEPSKIAAALKGASFDGPYGLVRISPKDNCMRTPAFVYQIQKAPNNPYGAKFIKKIVISLTAEELGPAE